MYYKAAKIGRKVRNVLKSNGCMSTTEINDVLFYVIYAVVAYKIKKRELTFLDVKLLDVESIDVKDIMYVANIIYEKYIELGGNSRIAKSKNFIDAVYLLFKL